MARSKEFDPDEALERAMRVFWRRGYSNTTMDELVRETGVVRASLYATFGNKAAIFRRGLEAYSEFRRGQVEAKSDPVSMVRQWYENAIRGARSRTEPAGCLLVGSTGEYKNLDPDLQKLIRDHLRKLERFFYRCAAAAQPDGDADQLANILMGANVAIFLLARAGAPERQLRDIAEGALSHIAPS